VVVTPGICRTLMASGDLNMAAGIDLLDVVEVTDAAEVIEVTDPAFTPATMDAAKAAIPTAAASAIRLFLNPIPPCQECASCFPTCGTSGNRYF
jgi:hypothetical protein